MQHRPPPDKPSADQALNSPHCPLPGVICLARRCLHLQQQVACGPDPTHFAMSASKKGAPYPVCQHFLKGGCNRGNKCRFIHSTAGSLRQPELVSILRCPSFLHASFLPESCCCSRAWASVCTCTAATHRAAYRTRAGACELSIVRLIFSGLWALATGSLTREWSTNTVNEHSQ